MLAGLRRASLVVCLFLFAAPRNIFFSAPLPRDTFTRPREPSSPRAAARLARFRSAAPPPDARDVATRFLRGGMAAVDEPE
jgi:hypothetical protein